jgi:hypothetical protein
MIISFNQLHGLLEASNPVGKPCGCQLVSGRERIHIIALRSNEDSIKNYVSKSSISSYKFTIHTRLEARPSISGNSQNSPEIVNTSYRSICCNGVIIIE